MEQVPEVRTTMDPETTNTNLTRSHIIQITQGY